MNKKWGILILGLSLTLLSACGGAKKSEEVKEVSREDYPDGVYRAEKATAREDFAELKLLKEEKNLGISGSNQSLKLTVTGYTLNYMDVKEEFRDISQANTIIDIFIDIENISAEDVRFDEESFLIRSKINEEEEEGMLYPVDIDEIIKYDDYNLASGKKIGLGITLLSDYKPEEITSIELIYGEGINLTLDI